MSSPKPNFTAILYQNSSKSITLMDLPRSIVVAQRTLKHPCLVQPLSSPPLRSPYPSTEPKPLKCKPNKAYLQGTTDNNLLAKLLDKALKEIAQHWAGEWCLQRLVANNDVLEKKASRDEAIQNGLQIWSILEPIMLPSEGIFQGKVADIKNRLICNDHAHTVNIRVTSPSSTYRVPPESSFILSKITESTVISFSMATLQRYPTASTSSCAGPGQFDLIVLDPPWQNRSARRAKHYQMMQFDDSPMDALGNMLGQHIPPGGLVACWITHKAAVREMALTAFADWGLDLIEEWVWLKVTVDGKPVNKIDGVWRKPYELLLIGRKSITGVMVKPGESSFIAEDIKERVIVAVSDFHSRKLSLKELIEPMLPDRLSYRALEIFARNLTAGWWAWGDEVLKYNDVLAWAGESNDEASASKATPN
ncbi:MAG: hypothetical protein Q9217_005220 [Psora testacea]